MIFYVLLVLIWEAVFRAGIWPPYLFPSPQDVFESLFHGFKDMSFVVATLASIQRILIGYTVSLIFGISLGLLVGRFRILDETVGSLMTALQGLPSICWLPLAILWFGLNEYAIQFVVIMGALIAIAVATDGGIKNIPPLYVRAARTMGVKGFALYARVVFPAALPSVATGMKLGWAFAWRALMAGELLFVSTGLGHSLQVGRELNDMNQVVSVMILIMLIGLVFDKLIFSKLEAKIAERWGTAR